jgi:hypothetical protein
LDNNEVIPKTQQLKITKTTVNGKLVDVPWDGGYMEVQEFILEKSILPSYAKSRMSSESKHVRNKWQNLQMEIQSYAEQEGLPVDSLYQPKANPVINIKDFQYQITVPKTKVGGYLFLLQALQEERFGYTTCFVGYQRDDKGEYQGVEDDNKFRNIGDILVNLNGIDLKGKDPAQVYTFIDNTKKNRKKNFLYVALIDVVALDSNKVNL